MKLRICLCLLLVLALTSACEVHTGETREGAFSFGIDQSKLPQMPSEVDQSKLLQRQMEADVPDPNEITEAEAVAFAKKVIQDHLAAGEQIGRSPLTQALIDQCSIYPVFAPESVAGRCWQVQFMFDDPVLDGQYGRVIVFLDPQDGRLLLLDNGMYSNG